jgi:hypothetical protein
MLSGVGGGRLRLARLRYFGAGTATAATALPRRCASGTHEKGQKGDQVGKHSMEVAHGHVHDHDDHDYRYDPAGMLPA